jgi:hypothetical protein
MSKLALLVVLPLLLGLVPAQQRNLAILSDNGRPICGAVLVAPDVVLTAAHCVQDVDTVAVRCLGNDLPGDVAEMDADEDLALVRLVIACQAPVARVAQRNP